MDLGRSLGRCPRGLLPTCRLEYYATGCDTDPAASTKRRLGKTVDERSLKDGAGPEAVVVGEACGRMLMVTATEKQGTAFVLDVTDPMHAKLLFTRHLSPASETNNPSVAYNLSLIHI